jgi:hypothetical protein
LTVGEIAKVLRSKNAGIGLITVDILCENQADYERVKANATRGRIARAYGVGVEAVVDLIHFDEGFALKIVFQRPQVAGGAGLGENDLYGSAQYAPLLTLEV